MPPLLVSRISLSCVLFTFSTLWICQAGTISEDYKVSSVRLDEAPSASDYDLAQTHYDSSSATGSNDAPSQRAELFNGLVGNDDGDGKDPGEVTMDSGNTITVNFDLSDYPSGYDIRAIDTYFGWKIDGGGRSNQGYSIEFTFVDNSTATIGAQHWEPNSGTASFWTIVSFEAGASGPIASGVKSMTFDISEDANVGGVVVGREFDIFGSPTGLEYAMELQPPNGYRIPKVLGASGIVNHLTGYDYLDWSGITEHRFGARPSYSSLQDYSAITSSEAFDVASEAVRADPMRQGTASDYYIDWSFFNREMLQSDMSKQMDHLKKGGITPMVINTAFTDGNLTGDWAETYRYWQFWYTLVYHYSSEYGVTMYEYRNEPHHNAGDYAQWESHWLVAADAIRKAIADVNRDFGKNLTPYICGPTCAGTYWDYNFPDPYVDPHGWGTISWEKVKYDIYGNYDVNNPWNYGMYDYHRYGQNADDTESILRNLRINIANANNDPNADIPLVITEYNTSTGGNFNSRELDTEDLFFGVSMAQILEASAVYGPDGLGDEGGLFIFKIGARGASLGESGPLVGRGNTMSYGSNQAPYNLGGITRGGHCFQMYARHFSGGKPLIPVVTIAGAHKERRTLAVVDEEREMYYIYGSNVEGADVPVSIDMSALTVESGAIASLQRVDEKNTGQITEFLTLSATKELSFFCPNNTAFLIKVPMVGFAPYSQTLAAIDDTTQSVVANGNQGAGTSMKVSNHHDDASQRNVALVRFSLDSVNSVGQALLKLSGKNSGIDPTKREILHVYAVSNEDWDESSTMSWTNAPGLGQYHIDEFTMGVTDGTGDMVDVEDNYAGFTSGVGTGLGINGEFVGAISFFSSEYVDNYLDVTDYLKKASNSELSPDVTFVIVRIVRYDVNLYSNDYYNLGEYHYDGRMVEIATKEHGDTSLHPALLVSSGIAPQLGANTLDGSSGVTLVPSTDIGGGQVIEFSSEGDFASFDVKLFESGTYLVAFRVASDSGSVNLALAQDGVPVTSFGRVVDTGDGWSTVYKMVSLEAGDRTLTVSATSDGIQRLNWIDLTCSDGVFEGALLTDLTNVALHQTASASSVHSPPYSADKAFDGDLNTRWASTEANPWLEIDFRTLTYIDGLAIEEHGERIGMYELQVFNDTWKTIFVGGNPDDNTIEWFSGATGSKFRLRPTYTTGAPSIRELELYGKTGISSTSIAIGSNSISLAWPTVPGATYSVLRSTDLATAPFTEIESGIPALDAMNDITIDRQDDPAAFFRITWESTD